MRTSRRTHLGAALGGAALLALGAALPAHAVTTVSSGHVDVVAINSAGAIGSKIGSTFTYWSGGTPAFDHEFVYNKPLGKSGVTCSSTGLLTINDGASGQPSLGLDNRTTSGSYTISVAKLSGSTAGTGAVTLDTPLASSVSTTGATEVLPAGGHEHGTWTFKLPDCSANKQYTFKLQFTASGPSTASKAIDFIIKT